MSQTTPARPIADAPARTWPIARRRVPEREAFALAASVLGVLLAGDGIPNTIHWYGFAALCALLGAWGVTVVVRARPSIARTPRTLWILLAWCLVSVVWSHWRFATVASTTAQVLCAVVAFAIASTLTWRRILDATSLALRWICLLSLVFEAVVAVVVRHPIAPVWSHYGDRHIPDAFYFSRAELFTGGRIQGLPGNANLLAMVALLAVIAIAVQAAEGRLRRNQAIGWLVVAGLCLVLTRSSTVAAAAVVTLLVLLAALAIRRMPTERRTPAYFVGTLVVVVAAVGVVLARGPLTHLLGRSSDLTGRGEIWALVWGMVEQHPVLGWGWIGYWWPNIPTLADLVHRKGVTYLQAHNATLDMWMQIGVVGMVLFLLYVLTTLYRAWACATRIGYGPDQLPRPFDPVSLFALLTVTALLVQSLAESRLLYQGEFVLFAVLAIKSRIVLTGEEPPSTGDGPRTPHGKREFRWAASRG